MNKNLEAVERERERELFFTEQRNLWFKKIPIK